MGVGVGVSVGVGAGAGVGVDVSDVVPNLVCMLYLFCKHLVCRMWCLLVFFLPSR